MPNDNLRKIGSRLAAFIKTHPPDTKVYIYLGLTLKTADLLAAQPLPSDRLPSAVKPDTRHVYQRITQEQNALIRKLGVHALTPIKPVLLNNTLTSTFTIEFILNTLIHFDEVKDVESVHAVPVEEFFGVVKKNYNQENDDQVEYPPPRIASEATKLSTEYNVTGRGVLVGLIDSGADMHPELRGRWWNGGVTYPNHGKNFGDGDPFDTSDIWKHGTLCAGIIAGATTGIATDATIMILRVIHTTTSGDLAVYNQACWDAIDFAAANGCHLCSFAGSFFNESEVDIKKWRELLDSIYQLGIPLVASAGSKGDKAGLGGSPFKVPDNMPTPANQPPPWLHADQINRQPGPTSSVITISATTTSGKLWPLSGRGAAQCTGYDYIEDEPSGLIKPDLCAPGGSIRTCIYRGGTYAYVNMTGTSPATAHAAGCLALMMEQPILTTTTPRIALVEKLLEALSIKAEPFPTQVTDSKTDDFGAGTIQAYQSYKLGKDNGWW